VQVQNNLVSEVRVKLELALGNNLVYYGYGSVHGDKYGFYPVA